MNEKKHVKVTLYMQDGSILKEAYIQCGKLMLTGNSEENIKLIIESDPSRSVKFTTKYTQGHFIPSHVETYYIKPHVNEELEIKKFVKETNWYNSTDDLPRYIKSWSRQLKELFNKF